jgi:hypothetical protein
MAWSHGLMIGSPVLTFRPPPAGIQFISMIWGEKNLRTADEDAAKKSGAWILLKFNQSDNLGTGPRLV